MGGNFNHFRFFAFKNMPIEAFPDVTNTQIIIITQWNGRSAEEVERFVTTPIELSMTSLQKKQGSKHFHVWSFCN